MAKEEEESKPEEKPSGESEEEEGKESSSDSSKKTLSPNERAEKNIESMKVENDRMEQNINAMQEMKAAEMLSGSADAGQLPAKKKEETPEEYAQRAVSGGLEDEK